LQYFHTKPYTYTAIYPSADQQDTKDLLQLARGYLGRPDSCRCDQGCGVGLAAIGMAVCADPGLAFGEIRVLADMPVRTPGEFQRLPGFTGCAAMAGLQLLGGRPPGGGRWKI